LASTFTIDASVFVNAFLTHEDGHEESRALLRKLYDEGRPLLAPALLLPEVASALARGQGDSELARRFADTLRRLPHLTLIPLDSVLGQEAADLAAAYRLRGADAVYVAVARRFEAALVTRDSEQRQRSVPVVRALTPAEALQEDA
jgi:predicted nucleic acid-binding protein